MFFAVSIDKASCRGSSVLELAHDELFSRFDSYLTRLHLGGESHRSLVIADESGYEAIVQKLLPRWKRDGSRIKRMHSMVEVPLYVDSKASAAVQAADFLAWATWNYFEHRHAGPITPLVSRFDEENGALHGFMHHIRGYRTCRCLACANRRDRVVPSVLPVLF